MHTFMCATYTRVTVTMTVVSVLVRPCSFFAMYLSDDVLPKDRAPDVRRYRFFFRAPAHIGFAVRATVSGVSFSDIAPPVVFVLRMRPDEQWGRPTTRFSWDVRAIRCQTMACSVCVCGRSLKSQATGIWVITQNEIIHVLHKDGRYYRVTLAGVCEDAAEPSGDPRYTGPSVPARLSHVISRRRRVRWTRPPEKSHRNGPCVWSQK